MLDEGNTEVHVGNTLIERPTSNFVTINKDIIHHFYDVRNCG